MKQKEEELEKKYAAVAQSAPQGSLTQAEVEAEKQKATAEVTEKYENKIKAMEKMHEMRQQLQIQRKEKEIQSLKDQLAGAGVVVPGPNDAKANASAASTEAQNKAAAALNPAASSFRPQGATATPAARPANPRVRPAPGTAPESTPVVRNQAGAQARPGTSQAPPIALPPHPGQSRLRPPLGARIAAVIVPTTGSTNTTPAAAAAPKSTATNTPALATDCLLYTSPSPRDGLLSRMPSSA